MESKKLTPLESLEIISESIQAAKYRIEGNGKVYAFWGILVAMASFGQFILLQKEMYSVNYYPYFLMPLGVLYTYYYFRKNKRGPLNQIGKMVRSIWLVVSLNLLIIGFGFYPILLENLIPVLMIILAIGLITSGLTIQSAIIRNSGIVVNLFGFVCFFIDWHYHSLIMGFLGIFAMFLPGMMLSRKQKN